MGGKSKDINRKEKGKGKAIEDEHLPKSKESNKKEKGKGKAAEDQRGQLPKSKGKAPIELDWTKEGVFKPVKNQMRSNICWALVAIQLFEAIYQITNGEEIQASVQYLMDNVKLGKNSVRDTTGCYTGSVARALRFMQTEGITLDSNYPFIGTRREEPLPKDESWTMEFIEDVVQIEDGDEEALFAAVQKQPVAAALTITAELRALGNEIYRGGTPLNGQEQLHAIIIVGFGYDKELDTHYYKVMNTWGPTWGVGGFGRIARPRSNGGTFVLTRVVYPVLKKKDKKK